MISSVNEPNIIVDPSSPASPSDLLAAHLPSNWRADCN
jgi:hypothetical protein